MHRYTLKPSCRILVVILLVSLVILPTSIQAAGESLITNNHKLNIRTFGLYTVPVSKGEANGVADGVVSCSIEVPLLGPVPFSGSIDANANAAMQSAAGMMGSVEMLFSAGQIGVEADLIYVMDLIEYSGSAGVTNLVGIDPSLVPDLAVAGTAGGMIGGVSVNYHWTQNGRLDLYAGPLFAPAVRITGIDAIEFGRSIAFGLNAGADYPLQDRWFFAANFKFIDLGEIVIREQWFDEFQVFDCAASIFQRVEAQNSLRFMAFNVGIGLKF